MKLSLFSLFFLLTSGQVFGTDTIKNKLKEVRESSLLQTLQGMDPQEEVNFTCVTSMPTTSIIVKTTDDNVRLSIIHHNGLKFSPIHKGIITKHDLSYLAHKSSRLDLMGEMFDVDFAKDRCRHIGNKTYDCFHSKPTQIGSLDVDSYSFQSYRSISQVYGYEFKTFHFMFSVRSGKDSLTMEMDYDATTGECSFN